MKENRFRRFSLTEVFLHGVNTIIYLILFVTGLILVFQRSLEIEWLSPKTLSIVHRITGIVLVIYFLEVLFLSIVAPSYRVIWKTISEALSWKLRDFVWLFKAPFHFLFHWISLPPSGKYNPGQKLNILVVVFTITGLILSGLWMILFPGTLIAWYIHMACFLLGSALLMLHLYLSLINPPTRKAIKGMLTGYVSIHYVREHHQLCLDEPLSKKRHVHLYRYPFILAGFLVLVVSFIGVNKYGPQRLKSQVLKLVQSKGLIAMLPGSLTLSHANVITDLECMKCHNLKTQPSSEKCTICHENIAKRINEKSGYHGGFTDTCMSCHKEHQGLNAEIRPLDKEAFNHQQANFHLNGKHAELDCEKCHEVHDETTVKDGPAAIRYLNRKHETCQSCHSDPHNDQMNYACTDCHTEQGWKGKYLLFSHNKQASYKLDTLHAGLSCDTCHKETSEGVTYRLTETKCESCHALQSLSMQGITDLQEESFESDPHWNRLVCIDCHNLNLSYQSTKEFANRCISCHNDDYGKLFYIWLEIFNLDRLQTDSMVSGELIEQINAIGFHNIKMSSIIWNDILSNNDGLPETNSN